jgi:glycerol-3-phosphate dehydrogenase
MPITELVVGVVHEGMRPKDMVHGLMTRMVKPERHDAR